MSLDKHKEGCVSCAYFSSNDMMEWGEWIDCCGFEERNPLKYLERCPIAPVL